MKYTIFLNDYCNDDNNIALIIDESQRPLVAAIFDFFDKHDSEWGYNTFPNTTRIKDFSAPDTSEDKVKRRKE